MRTVNIKELWLAYYQSHGFEVIPGAPLVHAAFPMSFNMSAGLIQLDPTTRSKIKVNPSKQCLVQKCFRHFDIDKVGDNTHLSFFGMPGAFEVVEFNETETIKVLWSFLTDVLEIDSGRIWVTTFDKEMLYSTRISQNANVPIVNNQSQPLTSSFNN